MKVHTGLCLLALFGICIEGFVPQYYPYHVHEHLKKNVESNLQFLKPKQHKYEPIENVDDFLASVKIMAEKAANCWAVPGFNLGIVIKNQTFNIVAGLDDTINSQTNFGIGSTSKAFTSMLVAELVEEGKLDWFTPVTQYTPRFAMFDPIATDRVTVRDMLTHKTGMPNHNYDLAVQVESDFSRSQLYYSIKTLEPAADFRTQWLYNNLMVMSAGHLAEEVTGSTWEDLVTDKIFNPLGMQRTCPDLDCALAAGNLAMPTLQVGSSTPVNRVDCGLDCNRWVTQENPAGGIYSNVEDLVKWVQVHLNTSDVELVSESTLNELHTPQTSLYPSDHYSSFVVDGELISIDSHSYAYNWMVENYRGWRHVQHGGTTWGFNAQVSLLPDIGIGFVGLSSGDNTNNALVQLAYYTFDLLIYGKSWVTESLICPTPAPVTEESKPKKQTIYRDSSDISEYAGDYKHPYFGTITWSYDQNTDSLYGTWQTAEGNTTYLGDGFFTWHASVTYLPPPSEYPPNLLEFPLEFQRNINGEIDSFAIPFQEVVPPIVFTNDKWIPRGVGWPVSH